jgi:amino acid adenylation domain-containing protein
MQQISAGERAPSVSLGPRTRYERDSPIHEIFTRQAQRAPHAIAVASDAGRLTYAALEERSNQIARYLGALGVTPGDAVGIVAERSLLLPTALLGILKAGATYVSLDPADAPERLATIVGDAALGTIVTDGTPFLLPAPAQVVDLVRATASIDAHSAAAFPAPATSSPAYVMYTSGSTGRPKGVVIEHRGVVRLVRAADFVRIGTDDVFLKLAPSSFDASTFEIWAPLLNGARLAIPPGGHLSVGEIGAAIERFGVSVLWLTAPLFRLVVDTGLAYLRGVRQLLAGGDVVSPEHARRFLRAFPGHHLINGYGPTENTTFSCCHTATSADSIGERIPIGRAIANSTAYVLDEERSLVAAGTPGELYVGGDGLAQGYLNRADLTAERFVADPFEDGGRLYRTGDLVCMRDDGALEFLGRIDRQVKIRGFRVELDAIEAVLGGHPGVLDAAVVVDERDGDKLLVAYVSGRVQAAQLRAHLARTLSRAMVPHAINVLDELPQLTSGKIDRAALARRAASERRAPVAIATVPGDAGAQLAVTGIWQAVLSGDAEIDLDENFFDAGGDSLMLMSVHQRLQDDFGVTLSLVDLFNQSTIRKQSALVERLLA